MLGQHLAESFFSAIKGELLDDQAWPTRAAARRAVTEYTPGHDGTRLHSALGYKTPADQDDSVSPANGVSPAAAWPPSALHMQPQPRSKLLPRQWLRR